MADKFGSKTDSDNRHLFGMPESTIYLEDKASFRHQSAAFKQVLDNSTKFRRRLPEPSGEKPGRLKQIAAWGEPQDDTNSQSKDSRKLFVYDRPLMRKQEEQISSPVGLRTPRIEGKGRLTGSYPTESTTRAPASCKRPSTPISVTLPPLQGHTERSQGQGDIYKYSRHNDDLISRSRTAESKSRGDPDGRASKLSNKMYNIAEN